MYIMQNDTILNQKINIYYSFTFLFAKSCKVDFYTRHLWRCLTFFVRLPPSVSPHVQTSLTSRTLFLKSPEYDEYNNP